MTSSAALAASSILSTYWNSSYPVDPFVIARRMGIYVYTADSPTKYGFEICPEEGARISLYVDDMDNPVRARANCATGLGAILTGAKHIEFARDFAACLLIPDTSLAILADREHVTQVALVSPELIARRTRLIQLLEGEG